jgi:hypothetical protein
MRFGPFEAGEEGPVSGRGTGAGRDLSGLAGLLTRLSGTD